MARACARRGTPPGRQAGLGVKLGVTLALAGCVALWSAPARAGEIVVVVNDQVAATSLSAEQVRAIFLGERHFWDGQRAYPVTYPDQAPIMQEFLSRVIGMNINQFKSYWIKRIFREGDVPPVREPSTADVLRAVAANAGGIGFVEEEDLGAARGVHPVFRFPG